MQFFASENTVFQSVVFNDHLAERGRGWVMVVPSLFCEWWERWNSPYINHFTSPDSIIPDQTSPESWNRYSYVQNNPLRYTDPSGHMEVENQDMQLNHASMNCSQHPQYCSNGKKKSKEELAKMRSNRPAAKTSIISATNNIGQPADPGNYCGGYCGQGGGLQAYTTGSGTYGDSIGSVPLAYSASYDVNVYDDLMILTLHEQYWMPPGDIPNMDSSTFGGSVLISQLNNGQQVKTNLGEFTPGNLAHPDQREYRDTSIQYYGKENFPTELMVRISFGAENVRATTVYYPLPFSP